ncbi:hypothetical protein BJX66DRAFT_295503 [Aspergillus keveii]|uniref:Uncharacterized protein n=1 Tax=Aspergillus keveii TaxID=714993 RepID=A0ABR4GH71_9EURO
MRLYLACASALQNPLTFLNTTTEESSREMKPTTLELNAHSAVLFYFEFASIVLLGSATLVSMATCLLKG